MSASADFTLEIVVAPPVVDDQARTTPFSRVTAVPRLDRRPLPGVDLRPAQQRAAEAARMPVVREVTPLPLPPPRHSWLPSARHAVPSRTKARSLLGVPPPPEPRAVPLSDEDEARMARRVRGYKKIAWAQAMLDKLFAAQP